MTVLGAPADFSKRNHRLALFFRVSLASFGSRYPAVSLIQMNQKTYAAPRTIPGPPKSRMKSATKTVR